MSSTRNSSPRSERPIPTLGVPQPDSVVLVMYQNGTIASQEIIRRIAKNRLAEAMNLASTRPKDFLFFCTCTTPTPPRLCLRRMERGELRFVCAPNSKREHASTCDFSGLSPSQQLTHTAEPSYESDWEAAMNKPMPIMKRARKATNTKAEEHTPSGRPPRKPWRAGPSKPTSQLLHLMDAAGINVYMPTAGTQAHTDVIRRLAAWLDRRQPAGAEPKLRTVVLGAGADPSCERLKESIHEGPDKIDPIVVVAEIIGVEVGKDGYKTLTLRHSEHEIVVHTSQWSYARKHGASRVVPAAVDRLSGHSSDKRVFALMHVVEDGEGRLEAKRAGLVATSSAGIPIDSSHELVVADYLVASGRHFVKPLFRKDGERYLRDFVLLDVGPPFYIEVNGMESEAYLIAKRASIAHLELAAFGRFLVWVVSDGPFPSDLVPPPVSTGAVIQKTGNANE